MMKENIMMRKKFLQIFLFNTKGINFVSHTNERERANRRSHVYTYTHRVGAEQRDTTRREGVRRWTWDAIVWASGTCPWLQESAMSYTPTYRIPRRRNAPLAPAGFARGGGEGDGGGTEGEALERGARESDPPAIFNEASIKKETARLCLGSDLLIPFLSLERVLSCTAAFSHPRAPRDPARTVGLRTLPRIAPRIFSFPLHPSFPSFYKMLNYRKVPSFFLLVKFVIFKLRAIANENHFFSTTSFSFKDENN